MAGYIEPIKKAIEEFGNIDVLVNNAGITRDNLLMRMSKEDFDKIFNEYQSLSNFDTEMINQIFDCADTDSDGKITEDELIEFEKKFIITI